MSTIHKSFDVQILKLDDEVLWTTYRYKTLDDTNLKGVGFELLSESQYIESTEKTIWDIIDTSWGIFILFFSIILQKITHYFNIKSR